MYVYLKEIFLGCYLLNCLKFMFEISLSAIKDKLVDVYSKKPMINCSISNIIRLFIHSAVEIWPFLASIKDRCLQLLVKLLIINYHLFIWWAVYIIDCFIWIWISIVAHMDVVILVDIVKTVGKYKTQQEQQNV